MWWQVIIAIVTLGCAVEAIRAKKLLVSAMWLAGTSALVALLLYISVSYTHLTLPTNREV